MENRTLDGVRVGDTVKVVRLNGEGALRRRIMDMGITKGCTIRVKNLAPFGDPVEIELRGYSLTLRKKDAEIVCVSETVSELP